MKGLRALITAQRPLMSVRRRLIKRTNYPPPPPAVAPFSGATTGTGGRIRDVQSVGRGGLVMAATAGYSFGNLLLPGQTPQRTPWRPHREP